MDAPSDFDYPYLYAFITLLNGAPASPAPS
jgi:hypothetical protein